MSEGWNCSPESPGRGAKENKEANAKGSKEWAKVKAKLMSSILIGDAAAELESYIIVENVEEDVSSAARRVRAAIRALSLTQQA